MTLPAGPDIIFETSVNGTFPNYVISIYSFFKTRKFMFVSAT